MPHSRSSQLTFRQLTYGSRAKQPANSSDAAKKRKHDYAQMPNECPNIAKQLSHRIQSQHRNYMFRRCFQSCQPHSSLECLPCVPILKRRFQIFGLLANMALKCLSCWKQAFVPPLVQNRFKTIVRRYSPAKSKLSDRQWIMLYSDENCTDTSSVRLLQ
jgi:hypothetical protein